jgi:endonuclease/exonuclease/phosphatase (EEP) superfamily protein YafD
MDQRTFSPGSPRSIAVNVQRIDRAAVSSVVAWSLVALWAAWTLVRLFGLEFGPAIPVIAFTPYVALAAVVPIALALVLRRWAAAGAAFAVAVVLGALVLPRAFGGPTEPAGGAAGSSLRVLAANVKFGKADAEALASMADALEVDVLAISELTPEFAARLERTTVGRTLSETALGGAPRAGGTGLYSRLALLRPEIEQLPGGFTIASATVQPPGGPAVEVSAVHTVPPTGIDPAYWRADLAALPEAGGDPLRVLLGDFNATLDHDDFRALVDRGYADAAATLGEGLTPTWPADRRVPPLLTIDHVLADERIGIHEFSVEDLPRSDHRPVFAELVLPAG